MEETLSSIVSTITGAMSGPLTTGVVAVIGGAIALGVVSVGAKWLWRKAKQWVSAA